MQTKIHREPPTAISTTSIVAKSQATSFDQTYGHPAWFRYPHKGRRDYLGGRAINRVGRGSTIGEEASNWWAAQVELLD